MSTIKAHTEYNIKQYLAKKWQKVKSVNILVYYKYSLYLCNKFKTYG